MRFEDIPFWFWILGAPIYLYILGNAISYSVNLAADLINKNKE